MKPFPWIFHEDVTPIFFIFLYLPHKSFTMDTSLLCSLLTYMCAAVPCCLLIGDRMEYRWNVTKSTISSSQIFSSKGAIHRLEWAYSLSDIWFSLEKGPLIQLCTFGKMILEWRSHQSTYTARFILVPGEGDEDVSYWAKEAPAPGPSITIAFTPDDIPFNSLLLQKDFTQPLKCKELLFKVAN